MGEKPIELGIHNVQTIESGRKVAVALKRSPEINFITTGWCQCLTEPGIGFLR